MAKLTIPCDYCGRQFELERREYNRGQRFCSISCSSSRKRTPPANSACAYCGQLLYRSPSKQRASKSGLVFCCREHKDLAQRIGGIKDIQPPHYGEVLADYRATGLKQACERCGYSRLPAILQVHHKDHNRKNNVRENLICLCPNCHAETHLVM